MKRQRCFSSFWSALTLVVTRPTGDAFAWSTTTTTTAWTAPTKAASRRIVFVAGTRRRTIVDVPPLLMRPTLSSSDDDNDNVSPSSSTNLFASFADTTPITATVSPNGDVFFPHDKDLVESISIKPPSGKVGAEAASAGDVTATGNGSLWERFMSSYLGPRALLLVLAAAYATNFPLGAIMNDNLPASAATTARMVLAALALSPAIPNLKPDLRLPAVLCGFFTATGYITQSLALVDVDPARVSFLGSATVLWCPLLEAVIDKKPMGLKDAPQTWLAAILCLAGVGVLELLDSAADSLSASVSTGDFLALLQAAGFGTGVYWTSRMLAKEPDQALPVTATLIATTSFLTVLWSLADGWMFTVPNWQSTTALPGLLFNADMAPVAGAIVWTGIVSTSLTFWIELMALGRVNPSEASVLLASEPLWAALFAAAFMGHGLSGADVIGGALIVSACLANAVLKPHSFAWLWGGDQNK